MSLPRSAAEVLNDHVVLEVEGIDRMYLNLYVPDLQRDLGVVGFFRYDRGYPITSGALMSPMTRGFVDRIERFAEERALEIVVFEKGQRKEDIAREHREGVRSEGIYLVGKAQEKGRVWRTETRRNPQTGARYPWIVWSTHMLDLPLASLSQGRVTYELRRLRHRGLIVRLPRTHRYQVTSFGLRAALFYSRLHDHLFRPALSTLVPPAIQDDSPLRAAFTAFDRVLQDHARRLAA